MASESNSVRTPRDSGTPVASPSANRTLTVLETLIDAPQPLTLTALARSAGIPLATCAAIASTLEARGYATRRVVGRSHFWRPTLRLYSLSTKLIRAVDPFQTAQPHLRALCDRLGMPAHLGVLDGLNVVYVAKAAAPGLIQFDTYPGKVTPFHLTALGRAIAAYLPEQKRAALVAGVLATGAGPKRRPGSLGWVMSELMLTRQRGYALEDEEEQADIGCVAAPVLDANDQVTHSIGITGFARHVFGDHLDQTVDMVVQTARALSVDLGRIDSVTD